MRELLLITLRALEEKLLNDECTPEELRHLNELTDKVDVLVTAKDIAKIYDKSEASVKMAISRNNIQSENPPKVRKFYSLAKIRKILPTSWRHETSDVVTDAANANAKTEATASK